MGADWDIGLAIPHPQRIQDSLFNPTRIDRRQLTVDGPVAGNLDSDWDGGGPMVGRPSIPNGIQLDPVGIDRFCRGEIVAADLSTIHRVFNSPAFHFGGKARLQCDECCQPAADETLSRNFPDPVEFPSCEDCFGRPRFAWALLGVCWFFRTGCRGWWRAGLRLRAIDWSSFGSSTGLSLGLAVILLVRGVPWLPVADHDVHHAGCDWNPRMVLAAAEAG